MKTVIKSSIMLAAVALATSALAASFTSGNLVVYRVGGDASGNTAATLTNVGNIVWLDEYQPLYNTSGDGSATNISYVQSIMLRTNYFGAYSPLLGSGTAFGSGLITRSVD